MASSGDAIQSLLERYDNGGHRRVTEEGNWRKNSGVIAGSQECELCCCGNGECAYLKRNEAALRALEGDVKTAARLGQVCALCISLVVR